MRTHVDCIPCLLRQAIQVAKLVDSTRKQERNVVLAVAELLKDFDMEKSPAEQAIAVYDKIAELTGCKDPYYEIKKDNNKEALLVIEEIRSEIMGSDDELIKATRMCIAGNIIDARQDNHCCRLQIDNILSKTNQHLRGSLATNTPVHIGSASKKLGPHA